MKKYFILIITLFIISSVRVYALEDNDYYVNYYGINISQYDYNRLLEYYSDDFIYSMNENEYEKVMENNLENVEVYSIGDFIDNSSLKRINLLTTEYKELKLIFNGNYITVSLKWNKMPKIRSYDVIAARTSYISNSVCFKQTYTTSDGRKTVSTAGVKKEFNNGVGYSFKLSNENSMEISLSFEVSESGTIYASYQHSKRTNTLANSQRYTISANGLGSVILFESTIADYYDAMRGVSTTI